MTEEGVPEAPVTETPVTETPVTETPVKEAPVTEEPVTEQVEPDTDGEPEAEPVEEPDEPSGPGAASSPTTTRVLLVLLVVLALAALSGGGYLVWHERSSNDAGIPRATDERPVRITNTDSQHAVAAAAQAAETIIATSYEDYDEQVEEALGLMTPEYGQETYLPTAQDSQEGIVESKTEVEVSIRAQGVYRADAQEVQVLLFLDQMVTKDGEQPLFTPYRVMVTMTRTGDGWLVSGLDTK